MSKEEVEILQRALARERIARKQAEKILEEKSEELYLLSQKNKIAKERLEALLKVKNSELNGFYENLIDPYIMMDLSSNVIKMNEAAESLINHKLDDGGINLMSLTLPEDVDFITSTYQEFIEAGKISNFQIKLRTSNSEIKLVEVNASVIYDEFNTPIAIQGIVRDITDLKKLEKQKEDLLKQLASSNESLQDYAHVVSHDLKSPLQSIYALVSWIKEDNHEVLNQNSLENIALIEETLEKMENLISNVLKNSRVGANLDTNQSVDIHALVHEVLQMMYIPKNITVVVPEKLPKVLGDKVKLMQVFQNLLSNAVKFNDKQKGRISISYKDVNTHYQFSVTDNGVGVDSQFFDKIFKSFVTLEKRNDSSGVGLSIVKKIVNMHGGLIWVESDKEKETTFYFTIKK